MTDDPYASWDKAIATLRPFIEPDEAAKLTEKLAALRKAENDAHAAFPNGDFDALSKQMHDLSDLFEGYYRIASMEIHFQRMMGS